MLPSVHYRKMELFQPIAKFRNKKTTVEKTDRLIQTSYIKTPKLHQSTGLPWPCNAHFNLV